MEILLGIFLGALLFGGTSKQTKHKNIGGGGGSCASVGGGGGGSCG